MIDASTLARQTKTASTPTFAQDSTPRAERASSPAFADLLSRQDQRPAAADRSADRPDPVERKEAANQPDRKEPRNTHREHPEEDTRVEPEADNDNPAQDINKDETSTEDTASEKSDLDTEGSAVPADEAKATTVEVGQPSATVTQTATNQQVAAPLQTGSTQSESVTEQTETTAAIHTKTAQAKAAVQANPETPVAAQAVASSEVVKDEKLTRVRPFSQSLPSLTEDLEGVELKARVTHRPASVAQPPQALTAETGLLAQKLADSSLNDNGLTARTALADGTAAPTATQNNAAKSGPAAFAAQLTSSDTLAATPTEPAATQAQITAQTPLAGQSPTSSIFASAVQENANSSTQRAAPAAEQVSIQINKAVSQGKDRISINLNPAELGRVEIKLDLGNDGHVKAVVSADRPETMELLQRDARGLERALQDAGLKTDSGSLSFNLKGEDQNQQQTAQDQSPSAQSPGSSDEGAADSEDIIGQDLAEDQTRWHDGNVRLSV